MTGSEIQCEGLTSSDAAQSDCENRTVVWFQNCWKDDMPVLGLAGCHGQKWKLVQVHGGDQSPLPPLWNSFVGTGIHNGPVPPAKLEVLHLYRWFTHLLRNILSNYWCGMHRTCKNTSFISDRHSWKTLREIITKSTFYVLAQKKVLMQLNQQ